ncbi:MAG: threonylcarbamoyl-AMP synthase [Candidatus Omnitrophica bacterium]|nr:threonylcarbamoyl-AMP synthase [Candidatus Omnitrophota bacterium]
MKDTKIFKVNPEFPDQDKIAEAAAILRAGGLVAFPTETVYGLAALPHDAIAVEKLRYIKNRYEVKKFSFCVHNIEQAEELIGDISSLAYKLMNKFWPGPLTLVLDSREGETVGLRMPDHPIAQLLLEKVGEPIFAPSANFPGEKAPVNAREVLEALDKKIDVLIDGGESALKISSAVCKVTDDSFEILRPGAITQQMINYVVETKEFLFVCTGNSCRSAMAEGMMKKVVEGFENIHVSSAGVAAYDGMPASKEAILVMKNQDIDISRHKARRVTKGMLKQADFILVMDKSHKHHILNSMNGLEKKVFLLKEFSEEKFGDMAIQDPIGLHISFYERVARELQQSIEGLVAKIK